MNLAFPPIRSKAMKEVLLLLWILVRILLVLLLIQHGDPFYYQAF